MNQEDYLYLNEALKCISNISFTIIKGAYFRGDYISVSVETIEEDGQKVTIVIICSAIGCWKIKWNKMAVLLKDNINRTNPGVFALFNDHGIAQFTSIPEGDYSLIPYNRYINDIFFQSQQVQPDSEYQKKEEISMAAEGSLSIKEPIHFKSINKFVEVTILPPGKETKIIFYSKEGKFIGRFIDFAFIDAKDNCVVFSDKVSLLQSKNSPEYIEGVWSGKIEMEAPLVFIFSDPY